MAGLSAAAHASRLGMKCLVVEKLVAGGGVCLARRVDSLLYTGDGWSFGRRLAEAARESGAIIQEGEEVMRITGGEDELLVRTDLRVHRARVVVVATGTGEKPLGVPGEGRLRGKGVHYCAQCAGFAYRNAKVAVVGGDLHAVRAAKFLAEMASEVLLLAPGLQPEAKALVEQAGVRLILGAEVLEFRGEESLSAVVVGTGEGRRVLEVDGVFIYSGRKPNSELVDVAKDADGYILVDSRMQTSKPGVLACGGVVGRSSLASSMGDGATAAFTAARRLGSV